MRHTFTPDDCKSEKNPKCILENNTSEKGSIDTKSKKDSDEICLTSDTDNKMTVHLNKNHGNNAEKNVENDSDGKNGTQTLNFNNVYLIAKNALNMNYHVIVHCLTKLFMSILTIIYHNCDYISGNCDTFLYLNKITTPIRMFGFVTFFLVFFYKLKKISETIS